MSGVHKWYGGVHALNGADLTAEGGEIHGLLGPNGSGKSTLNKVLAGSVAPDAASIRIDGTDVEIPNPIAAYRHGVAAVYQQLSVLPDLTVEQNLALGLEPHRVGFISTRVTRRRAAATLDRFRAALGAAVTGRTMVGELSPGQQQIVEIGKAILREPRILVLDEATASLRRDQVALLFDVVREMCATGTAVVMVSHRLDEILQICDRATVMRSGATVATVDVASTTAEQLVELMVGEHMPVATSQAEPAVAGKVTLEVEGLTGDYIHDVSFAARRGEVIGLGGLQGQGQSELLQTMFGIAHRRRGTLRLRGELLMIRNGRQAARRGLALVPGDRGTQGMFGQRPIQENLSIVSLGRRVRAGFIVSSRAERAAATGMIERLRITIGKLANPISSLSGGNQQKVIVGKWLLNEPQVFLLDDPTKGVDVSSKAEIYAIIRELTRDGATILFNSSDDNELVEVCDRVMIMYEGTVLSELRRDELTVENLVSAALLVNDDDGGRSPDEPRAGR
jgi:ribose transport system ATP-binding protein